MNNNNKAAYSPYAPPVPLSEEPRLANPYHSSRSPQPQDYYYSSNSSPSSSSSSYEPQSQQYRSGQPSYPHGCTYPPQQQYPGNNYQAAFFSGGNRPGVIRSFQMVDRDGSGVVEVSELQRALSSCYQRFSMRSCGPSVC